MHVLVVGEKEGEDGARPLPVVYLAVVHGRYGVQGAAEVGVDLPLLAADDGGLRQLPGGVGNHFLALLYFLAMAAYLPL